MAGLGAMAAQHLTMTRRILFLLSFVPLIAPFAVMSMAGFAVLLWQWLRTGKADDQVLLKLTAFMQWPFRILKEKH
jgi:hypothetical protein